MKKAMTILYKVHNNLYVNLTNRCSSSCVFCLRNTKDHMEDSGVLWLEREPSVEEVLDAFAAMDLSGYDEIVFCGFGEPTERAEDMLAIAKVLKERYDKPIRLNTNGQGNLINERNIVPDMRGLIDTVSISLNTPDEKRYHELVRSRFGDKAYGAMLDFAREAKDYVPNVILSTVETTISREEEAQCQAICDELGVTYRIRPFE